MASTAAGGPAGPGLDGGGRWSICLPWLDRRAVRRVGGWSPCSACQTPASGAASWGQLLRFAAGPDRRLAAGLGIRSWPRRHRWCWPGASGSAGRPGSGPSPWSSGSLAWVIGRGWTGSLAIDPLVLLGPGRGGHGRRRSASASPPSSGTCRKAEFGWRQLVTVVGVAGRRAGLAPDARLGPPRAGGTCPSTTSASRWPGCTPRRPTAPSGSCGWAIPRSLNQGGWNAGDGLAYATSEDGRPDARWLWNATGPGPAGRTGLGGRPGPPRPHRPAGQPGGPGRCPLRGRADLAGPRDRRRAEPRPSTRCPPTCCPPSAASSTSSPCCRAPASPSIANAAWVPAAGRGPRPARDAAGTPTPPAGRPGDARRARGARPSCPGRAASRSFEGPLTAGTVFSSAAPAGDWQLTTSLGAPPPPGRPSFGWAVPLRGAGPATTGHAPTSTAGSLPLLAGHLLGPGLGPGPGRPGRPPTDPPRVGAGRPAPDLVAGSAERTDGSTTSGRPRRAAIRDRARWTATPADGDRRGDPRRGRRPGRWQPRVAATPAGASARPWPGARRRWWPRWSCGRRGILSLAVPPPPPPAPAARHRGRGAGGARRTPSCSSLFCASGAGWTPAPAPPPSSC